MQRLPSTGSDLITAIAAALAVGAVAAFAATGITFRDATDVAVHPATIYCGSCSSVILRWTEVLKRMVQVQQRALHTTIRLQKNDSK